LTRLWYEPVVPLSPRFWKAPGAPEGARGNARDSP